MAMLNSVSLQGRLTKDPTVDRSGINVRSNFTLAVEDNFKKDKAHFFRCTAWGKTAEFVGRWFKKGDMMMLRGRLTTYVPKDSENAIVSIDVEEAFFAGSKKQQQEETVDEFVYREEDLPF